MIPETVRPEQGKALATRKENRDTANDYNKGKLTSIIADSTAQCDF
ncbi:hypothetical protein [Colwellia sp. MT41]|nr:hypothetical protein [Colwellia sp. MT41]